MAPVPQPEVNHTKKPKVHRPRLHQNHVDQNHLSLKHSPVMVGTSSVPLSMGPLVENQGLLVHWGLADATECHEVTDNCRQTAGHRCCSSILLVIAHGDLHSNSLNLSTVPPLLRVPWLGITFQGSGTWDFEEFFKSTKGSQSGLILADIRIHPSD